MWINVLLWVFRPFNDSFRIIEMLAIMLAITAFFMELDNQQEEREARAWQLITTEAVGNSGKVWALQSLNNKYWSIAPNWWLLKRGQLSLEGVDLSPPDLPDGGDMLERVTPFQVRCQQERHMTYLARIELPDAELLGAKLICTNLLAANLIGARLVRADFRGAILRKAILQQAVLVYADLRDTDLTDARLQKAWLTGADLRGANLASASLDGANLWQADLRGASGIQCKQLKQAKNWESAHRNEEARCGAETVGPLTISLE